MSASHPPKPADYSISSHGTPSRPVLIIQGSAVYALTSSFSGSPRDERASYTLQCAPRSRQEPPDRSYLSQPAPTPLPSASAETSTRAPTRGPAISSPACAPRHLMTNLSRRCQLPTPLAVNLRRRDLPETNASFGAHPAPITQAEDHPAPPHPRDDAIPMSNSETPRCVGHLRERRAPGYSGAGVCCRSAVLSAYTPGRSARRPQSRYAPQRSERQMRERLLGRVGCRLLEQHALTCCVHPRPRGWGWATIRFEDRALATGRPIEGRGWARATSQRSSWRPGPASARHVFHALVRPYAADRAHDSYGGRADESHLAGKTRGSLLGSGGVRWGDGVQPADVRAPTTSSGARRRRRTMRRTPSEMRALATEPRPRNRRTRADARYLLALGLVIPMRERGVRQPSRLPRPACTAQPALSSNENTTPCGRGNPRVVGAVFATQDSARGGTRGAARRVWSRGS
ncbi:hypothetical protein B0H10DRAFT_2442693 [Mycena sp. CBHHK59/15]|nr:hypothetical protein B0H10DRAFT_2442693 [Mycena sp. CBHHK59/15]